MRDGWYWVWVDGEWIPAQYSSREPVIFAGFGHMGQYSEAWFVNGEEWSVASEDIGPALVAPVGDGGWHE